MLALRELAMLFLAQYGLRHGVDIEINWPGRISVFPIMGGILLALVVARLGARRRWSIWGLAMAILATVLYARGRRRATARARRGCKLSAQSSTEPSTSS